MWNDEDNNPYGSFDRRDSTSFDVPQTSSQNPRAGYDRPSMPTSGNSSPANEPPEFVSQAREISDEENEEDAHRRRKNSPRKKGAYDSRIEQLLYEVPDLQIIIVDAGKSQESGGSYISYTIRTGDLEVRRRYSEFSSLRATLVNLHPTLIIPPIPEKHSMADYAAKPTKAKEDMGIIDLRKRMLGVFLNRCRKMKEVREDGFWWRFLDPNASWNEVLHSHPVVSIPKSNMKAPPLDPANPTPAHQWLPVPSSSARLKSASRTSASGTPSSPPQYSVMASSAAHSIPGPQVFGRFPPSSQNLSEQDLDPYFNNFENSTRELELLLQGNIEKVNRRTLTHLSSLATDMAELGARYNGFSLSEQSTVAAAIERIGQAVDSSYIATEELSSMLGANFAEPMRESAQFAGVVRSVLRFRVLKRVQEDMTKEELFAKRQLLDSLERSELEAKRIEQYLTNTGAPSALPKRSKSSASARTTRTEAPTIARRGSTEDTVSIDSDFPPTRRAGPPSPTSVSHGNQGREPTSPSGNHKKSPSGGFVANKIFGRISHAVQGIVDVDPERTRRDQMGKTRESLEHLQQALGVAEQDVKDASAGILKDLKRFQLEKEDDLRRYMIAYAQCHVDWAKKNVETWREAKEEVEKIDVG
ncbi:Sorting nexin, cytoplasm-to-vacuole targeting pathway/endosomal sorting [Pseudocyphellaria aurata]|nr:Sorting nexin, cytoplasm-to-vacuole targeting pathway/endosomal sorting [Pseudocyphellaria aurata]